MILYLDTSALVKVYVEEEGSEEVAAWIGEAEAVATVHVAYPETRAAFARARREGILTPRQLRAVVSRLDDDWGRYSIVLVSESLVRRAGRLAERRALRGYDAIHLAAALEIRSAGETPAFGCFDDRLMKGALAEGLIRPAPLPTR